ncbi:MAG: hydrogenase expression/formation protein HypE [Acidobacteriota bacterium]
MTVDNGVQKRVGRLREMTINMAHGSGGKKMRDLIEDVFLGAFHNSLLAPLEDQAVMNLADLAANGDRLAFTTDSYVVSPLFFPGGNIGALAVNGTVNDLAMCGARPLYLSCGMVLEEGLSVDTLRQVAATMREMADTAGVAIVTGDTKVVERGAADKLFINTSGVGVIPKGINISAKRAQVGDKIIINGYLGDHGCAILLARNELALETDIESDCQALHDLVRKMLEICPDVHCLRDATRGGLGTVLNEFAESSNVAINITEKAITMRENVKGACELLGLDPLYLANEGKLVAIVPPDKADELVETMRKHPAGEQAAIIGEVVEAKDAIVVMQTAFGGSRIVDLLVGEQLPRIC